MRLITGLFVAGVLVPAFSAPRPARAQEGFGATVAVAGDVVFVGDADNIAGPGRVYAYRRAPGGEWAEVARLTAPNAAAGDHFGSALAASGDLLLVSGMGGADQNGAVYVFERQGAEWRQAGRLAPSIASDTFGIALALDGDAAVVGASGSAYVFRRANGSWAQEARVTASDGAEGDRFGTAVAIAGDRILVGAPGQAKARGGAYLFVRDGASGWREEGRLVARTVSDGDALGARVAVADDRFIVSAPQRDEGTGAVYIFQKLPEGEGYGAFTRLYPFDASPGTQFGATLRVSGEELWIGAPGDRFGQGTIYRFQQDSAQDWTAVRKLSHEGGGTAVEPAAFGLSFDVVGPVAVAGMPFDDYEEGGAVLLSRTAGGDWSDQTEVTGQADAFAAVSGKPVECKDEHVAGFECGSVELLSFMPARTLGAKRGVVLNDLWGWTDPTSGREYALVGRTDGTAFVDVTDAGNPRYLGELPLTAGAQQNVWRDIKVYKDHAFIVADGAGKHGMQVFDLTQLRNANGTPVAFEESAHYDRIDSAHNIVIDEASGFAYAVGANGGGETCGGGLHMIDVRDPDRPKFAGCFADATTGRASTGYTHDAQCVVYHGPDSKYAGKQICLGSNETALSIADVTDKAKPVAISRATYPNVGYTHQGWLTDDQRYFYMDDELDEMNGLVPRTRTIIWDVSQLDDPQVAAEFLGTTGAIDHNLYVKGDRMYQSDYVAGLRVLDISDREHPREIGYFDSVPNSPNKPVFNGSWSNYPFFKSGIVVFTSMKEGLFIVKPQPARPVS